MCVHFQSWNRCSSCLLTFNRRRNRVPCWNGSLSHWRIHHHGLSCRNGQYERAPDEAYTHRCCEACRLEAANKAAAAAAAAAAVDEKKSGGGGGGTMETPDQTAVARPGWRSGKRVAAAAAAAAATTTTRKRATNVKKMLLLRWWALKEALCGRGSVCMRKRGEKRLARARIWMLGYL